jgi:hypothetical protein
VTLYVYGYFVLNEFEEAYEEGERSASTIRKYIIEGAGYFLKSNSNIQLFLNKIELSELNGMDYSELQNIINSAIENMENAKETYINLISIAKVTPYNPFIIEKLQLFDYPGFQKENKLNSEIFKQVETFLSIGDVTGLYIKFKLDIDSILVPLYNIKASVYNETFPEISSLWLINQKYSELVLFGQYGSQVFFEIKQNAN